MSISRVLLAAIVAIAPLTAAAQAQNQPTRDPRNYIGVEDLEAAGAANAQDIIRRLRPHWLRTRGQSTLQTRQTRTAVTLEPTTDMVTTTPVVYIDGMREGSVSVLRNISAADIQEIEYLNAAGATQRFGVDHAAGAILVKRRVR